ncbi:MAG: DUF364 domain-containing protein [Bacillota bacterium]|nr:DUF364 domain-containing protein [Bacillota bacterium]
MWDFYDKLINEVPDVGTVDFIHAGETWTMVSAGSYCGIAITVNEQNQPIGDYSYLLGKPLKDVAALCKSWDFGQASVGTAALNAWLNSPEHLKQLDCRDTTNGFDDYRQKAAGKKVAIIGHFVHLERFLTESQVYVLERRPKPGDYPDSACEYILPEVDYTFITGSAFINKTLPRLLQLSKNAVVLGPSTPMSSVLFAYGAKELSGFSPDPVMKKNAAAIGRDEVRFKDYGRRICVSV